MRVKGGGRSGRWCSLLGADFFNLQSTVVQYVALGQSLWDRTMVIPRMKNRNESTAPKDLRMTSSDALPRILLC